MNKLLSTSILPASVGFSGTGKDGKPKVIAGKAGYTYDELKPLKTSPNVEFVSARCV